MNSASGSFYTRIGHLVGTIALCVLVQPGCAVEEPPPAASGDADSDAVSDTISDEFHCTMTRPFQGRGELAVDRQGNLFVATGPMHRGEGSPSVVRKIDMNGRELWAYHVPNGDELIPFGVTTDASGAVVIVGRGFRTEFLPNGVENIISWAFLLKLNASGQIEFRRDLVDSATFREATVAPGGEIVVYGRYSSSLDLGGGPMPDSGGASTAFIAKFSSTGQFLWTKDFGDPDQQSPRAIATDSKGAILIAGRLMATFDFGGGPLTPTPNSEPHDPIPEDAFLVKYDASGKHVWTKIFGGDGIQWFKGLTTDAADNAIVLGVLDEPVLQDDGQFVQRNDMVVAVNPQGEQLFRTTLPTKWHNGERIAASASGDIFVAGTFNSTIDLEGKQLRSTGGTDLYVLRLDPRGVVQTGVGFGGIGNDILWGFAVSPMGGVTVGGYFQGPLNLGCGSFSSSRNAEVLIVGFTLQ